MKLPPPYDKPGMEPNVTEPKPEWSQNYVTELDGYVAIDVPWKPKSKEEEDALVQKFISGLRKLIDKEANWTFIQPFFAFAGILRPLPNLATMRAMYTFHRAERRYTGLHTVRKF